MTAHTYRIDGASRARPSLRELVTKLEHWFVALEGMDPVHFDLHGPSPSQCDVPLRAGAALRIDAFAASSTIHYAYGRELGEPTNRFLFYNQEKGDRAVYFRLAFDLDGPTSFEATVVEAAFELRLGREVVRALAGPRREAPRHDVGPVLRRLALLTFDATQAETAQLMLPEQPPRDLESVHDVGWLTLLPFVAVPLQRQPPPTAQVISEPFGALVLASSALDANATYGDVAADIEAVRTWLAPSASASAPRPPAARPPGQELSSYQRESLQPSPRPQQGAFPAGAFRTIAVSGGAASPVLPFVAPNAPDGARDRPATLDELMGHTLALPEAPKVEPTAPAAPDEARESARLAELMKTRFAPERSMQDAAPPSTPFKKGGDK